MSTSSPTFVDLCISREVDPEAIDHFVAAWHEGEGDGSLHEFLGLTREEYALWVENPNSLSAVLQAKRLGRDAADVANRPG